jgi:hypothetical protein
MARFGLVGPAYRSQSVNADAQRCVNWYPEKDESGGGRSDWQLYPTPGSNIFSEPAVSAGHTNYPGPLGQLFPLPNGRLIAVRNLFNVLLNIPEVRFYDISSIGVATPLNVVADGGGISHVDGAPMPWAVSATHAWFIVGGVLYYDTLAFGGPTRVVYSGGGGNIANAAAVVYLDGYFLVLLEDSQDVLFTLDPTQIDPLDIFRVSITADYVRAMIVDHRELWLLGDVDTVVYSNVGDADNPFQPNPSGFIQEGIAAARSLVQLDNTLMWIGKSPRGNGIAWRANGYVPQRISTFAIEFAWQGYARIDDAVAYAYQDQGHSFWVIYFPSANKTWVYDVSTGAWHERMHLIPVSGLEEAHRSWVYAFAFGKHLIGDWKGPTIYEMRIPVENGTGGWDFATDFGDPIEGIRIAPHIANEGERIFVDELQVFLESGLGPMPPLSSGVTHYAAPVLAVVNLPGGVPAGTYDVILAEVDGGGGLLGLSDMGSRTLAAPRILQVAIPNANANIWQIFISIDGGLTWTYLATPGPIVGDFSITATILAAMVAGTPPDQSLLYREPQIELSISRDGGHSFGQAMARGMGMAGEFAKRVRWLRLGQARDWS